MRRGANPGAFRVTRGSRRAALPRGDFGASTSLRSAARCETSGGATDSSLDAQRRRGMFSREQIFIDPHFAGVLKAWQKDTLFHAGDAQLPLHHLVRFAKEWFEQRAAELAERRAREAAWREMWSGRKGEILRLFTAVDADADGELDLAELEVALDAARQPLPSAARGILLPSGRGSGGCWSY